MWIHDFVNCINSGNSRWLKCWSLGVLDNWLIIDIGNVYSKTGFKMNNIDIPTIILKHSENKKWLWDEAVTQNFESAIKMRNCMQNTTINNFIFILKIMFLNDPCLIQLNCLCYNKCLIWYLSYIKWYTELSWNYI